MSFLFFSKLHFSLIEFQWFHARKTDLHNQRNVRLKIKNDFSSLSLSFSVTNVLNIDFFRRTFERFHHLPCLSFVLLMKDDCIQFSVALFVLSSSTNLNNRWLGMILSNVKTYLWQPYTTLWRRKEEKQDDEKQRARMFVSLIFSLR